MGKPGQGHAWPTRTEYIGAWSPTQGTDTSKYLKEEKSNEIPQVAASERGLAQTGGKKFLPGLWDSDMGLEEVVERSGKAGHRG